MKKRFKFFPLFMALSAALAFTGCTAAAELKPPAASQEAERSAASSQSKQSNAAQSSAATSLTGGANSLVVYFSWSGNTQQMAQWIADESGGDLYRVTPKEAYGEDFESCADRAKNELDNGIRPELTDLMDAETMAQYDTIYVGFPVWWYDLPMVMTAFLESYDLTGKTIIPFFSHNGSSSGAAAPDALTKICKGATVLSDSALSISGDNVESSETQIRQWAGSFAN